MKKRWFYLFICFVLLNFLAPSPISARESNATNKGSGPMYWITYEHQFENNTFMPEDRWQKNVDWIAKDFLPYGYDLVSTDGWIEGSTKHNENGYVVSHNDSWKHDWKYWADYVHAKGLKFGIYYNPLWVTPAAVNNPNATVIGRPDIKIKDIVNEDDRFNGGQPTSLYWVDVTKDGAREYVEGYVKFFKAQGADFLRVDFLSWYETGTDKGIGVVGKEHGREQYETALKWMSEAAGKDMNLSLVMPHLKNHGELEQKYGDMIRIDEDTFHGGWDHLSARRQEWTDTWSQWANPFQGFTGFADISGKGKMILDGDFLRLNTFKGEWADHERKTAISLFTMAGSPIAIADQYDTIGDNAKYYQNSELIALNKAGFIGKPIFKNGEHYKFNGRDSERWVGQLPNGDWIVALFNRSDYAKTVRIDFEKDLGITSLVTVRDLWEHQNLGYQQNFEKMLQPHDSVVLKLTQPSSLKKYQAETTTLFGEAKFNNNHNGYSGFGFIENIHSEGAKVRFDVSVPQAGEYKIQLRYGNGRATDSIQTLTVNREKKKITFPSLSDWDKWSDAHTTVLLKEGINTLTVGKEANDTEAINLDYIRVNQ
ncbi:carbohydrate-binding protein [Priestia megaterium]|nr:carbohydrate-binding protein [Priestia megaterium]